jgi:hypothetical protein
VKNLEIFPLLEAENLGKLLFGIDSWSELKY